MGTTFNDMVSVLGGVPLSPGFPFSKDSKYFFVDPARGSAGASGAFEDPVDSVSAAEALCTANQHDTVIYIAGATGAVETASLTWDKSYTHLIGIAAPTMVAKRARIHNETTTGQTPLLDITATGCIFKNFYIFQGVNEAVGNLNVRVTGGRNYFEGVHFAGGGHSAQAIDGGASLALYGAEENLFVNCTIGVDTIAAATGMMGIRVDSAAVRNVFRNCNLTMYAGNSGAGFVEIVDSAGFDRYLLFDNCLFINDAAATTMASAFVIPGGMGSATHRIILKDTYGFGFTDWDASDRGLLYLTHGTKTGGGNSGIALVSAAT